ncbi:hypothetical protein [Aliiroseovarius sediminilitoris]|uniref:hypothetical protein n=1 Tax=Aliiroseovarius sediminilitoris TaxID=1173584 RepID=UPI0015A5E15B|nr:hypothetical protein [Aliiroseovarius sediminilitoris]
MIHRQSDAGIASHDMPFIAPGGFTDGECRFQIADGASSITICRSSGNNWRRQRQ